MFQRLFGRSGLPSNSDANNNNNNTNVARENATGAGPSTFHHSAHQTALKPNTQQQQSNSEALGDQIELIEKRQHVLEIKIEKETEKAKEYLLKKNKIAATQCLQRRTIYEGQLTKLQSQLMNIERIRLAVEENAMNAEVMKAQRIAAADLQRLQQGMNPEDVDKDMDQLRELLEKTNEVSEALAQEMGTSDGLEEEDLEEQLAALQQEAVNDRIAANKVKTAASTTTSSTTAPQLQQQQQFNPNKNQSSSIVVNNSNALSGLSVPSSAIGQQQQQRQQNHHYLPQKKETVEEEEDDLAALERELNS